MGANGVDSNLVTGTPNEVQWSLSPNTYIPGSSWCPASPPWVQIDLGTVKPISGVTVYHLSNRRYCSQKIQISTDETTWTTIYDTGTGFGPDETTSGNTILISVTDARYIRHSMGGGDSNAGVHFIHMDVLVPPHGYNELATHPMQEVDLSGATVALSSGDNWYCGSASSVIDGDHNPNNWSSGGVCLHVGGSCVDSSSNPYVDIDMSRTHKISALKVWHYYADSREVCGQSVELSLDGTNWSPVWDTGSAATPPETSAGNTIYFQPQNARFIRYRAGRSKQSAITKLLLLDIKVLERIAAAQAYGLTTKNYLELDLSEATVVLDNRFTWHTNAPDKLVDGDYSSASWGQQPATEHSTCGNPDTVPFVQIELEHLTTISGVWLWHYWLDGRKHCSQSVKVSEDGATWKTVWTTGTEFGPEESESGNRVLFDPVNAKYVRHHASKSNLAGSSNVYGHFLEMKVLVEASGAMEFVDMSTASVSLDPRYTWSRYGIGQGLIDGITRSDGSSDGWQYAPSTAVTKNCGDPEKMPYVEVDLGQVTANVAGVVLYHYYTDGRKYCSQNVMLSKDGTNWITVYDTGNTWGPSETSFGNTIYFTPTDVRYIRHHMGGNTANSQTNFGVQFIELKAFRKHEVEPSFVDLAGASVTLDSRYTWSGGDASAVIDTDVNSANLDLHPHTPVDPCGVVTVSSDDSPWVQIELDVLQTIEGVVLFHHRADGHQFCKQSVKVSEDGTNWVTVYDIGLKLGAPESSKGTTILFSPVRAKFIRHHAGGSNRAANAHFLEIKVISKAYQSSEYANLSGATVTLDDRYTWARGGAYASALIDGNSDAITYQTNPVLEIGCGTNLPDTNPYVQVDLGQTKRIYGAHIFHYWMDGRRYCGQSLKVSVDGNKWVEVWSTGKGYGPPETSKGNIVFFESIDARYVRHHSGGSSANDWAHFLELKVFESTHGVMDLSVSTVTLDTRFSWKDGPASDLTDGNWDASQYRTNPSISFPASTTCVSPDQAPYAQIDLMEAARVYGVTVFHYYLDGRRYCGQSIKVSLDGIRWDVVWTTGAGYGPVEVATGNTVYFPAVKARYIRHHCHINDKFTSVNILEMQVLGSRDVSNGIHPQQLASYENGDFVYSTQNGKTFVMQERLRDGVWTDLGDSAWLEQVAVSNSGSLYGVNPFGQLLSRNAASGDWNLVPNFGGSVAHISIDGAGTKLLASAADGTLKYTTNNVDWTTDAGTIHQTATNSAGNITVGLIKTNNGVYIKPQNGHWVVQAMPAAAGSPIGFAVAGLHEVWMIDENHEVWHAWIDSTSHSFKNWVKVDNKLLQISATRSGAIYGVSEDGNGVLYCPNREPTDHAFTCGYVIGPFGVVTPGS